MAAQPDKKDFWTADTYGEKVAPFVSQLTETVVSWLNPQPNDTILDVGCGEGALTARLAPRVAHIAGIDSSANMIAALQTTNPEIASAVVDCGSPSAYTTTTTTDPSNPSSTTDKNTASSILRRASYSALFSNAALHWILRPEAGRAPFFRTCADLLQPGGRMVSESGALGNVAEVHAVLRHELLHGGYALGGGSGGKIAREDIDRVDPWFFPSLAAMRGLVEQAGLRWVRGEVELRQTTLTQGEDGGVRGWIRLFGDPFAALLEGGSGGKEWNQVVDRAAATLERVGMRDEDGRMQVNYVRLRFEARKAEA